ncbi:MAG TPA: aldehyde dehydrogenase family protein [Gemmatimonadaceae bacterium]|nr:aldehyde dehydrogenase family protein [Gemmatimonadaceae bacterium]
MTSTLRTPDVVASIDPATGETWRRFDAVPAGEVPLLIESARAAQREWARVPPRERADVVRRLRRRLFARRGDMARSITRESGKSPVEAIGEVLLTLEFARWYARVTPRELRRGTRAFTPAGIALARKRVRIVHEPLGVIGCISPWNYPLVLAAGVVIPALLTGNAVVLKPSELTTASAVLLADLFREAGLPGGVLTVAPGGAETGAALVESGTDKIFFIGSEAAGRKVALACAERLKPYVLELGGSDAAIVLDDADVDLAAEGIAWGRFANAGQSCVAPKRVFVVAPIHDAFVERVTAVVHGLRVGPTANGGDVGPVIRPRQVALLDEQLGDAMARGARVAARAAAPPAGADAERYFLPTVLTEVSPDMRVMTEETFGPLLAVQRVRDEREAIERANATSFGLAGSVWSTNHARARLVAEQLDVGAVMINDSVTSAGMADVPHGGNRSSGIGRSHGLAGIHECVRSKAIIDDLLPMRQLWWFGYDESLLRGLDDSARMSHGPTVGERIAGALGTARMVMARLRGKRG